MSIKGFSSLRKNIFMIRKICLSIAVIFFSIQLLHAQKYSNEFLSIGVSAKAQALGNSVAATVDDVTAAYWNPAGLSHISNSTGLQLSAMHAEWFAGVGNYDYLGVSLPMKKEGSRLALSLIRFGIDGIPNTLSLFEDDGTINYDNIIEFSAADYAFLGTYAQRLKIKSGQLSVGGNIKVVRRLIGQFANSWGFGVDLGAQYRKGGLRLGLTARDITTTFNSWSINFTEDEKVVLLETGNELPNIRSNEITRPGFQLGAAYQLKFKKFSLTPEADFFISTDGQRNVLVSADPISMDIGGGLELGYRDAVFLRAGIDQFQKEQNFDGTESLLSRPSLGIGLKLAAFRLDYAFTDLGDSRNTYSHVISLLLNLKKREKERS